MSERYAFPSPAAALDAFLPRLAPVAAESVPLADAGGRILAEPVAADRPSPAVDVSAMDGYAVRAAEAAAAEQLPIAGRALIGREPPTLPPGACIHIVTGAPIPPGADAVIRREDVTEAPDHIRLSPEARAVRPGTSIRRRGENAPEGAAILEPGLELTPAAIGALAAFGVVRPRVRRGVRVAILTTGDEVVDPAETPTPWCLRNSNGYALQALFSRRRWSEVAYATHVPDDPASLERAFREALERCDAVIATGGVSMGDRDYVPAAVRAVGGEVVFHRIPQRPGKPILGAMLKDGRPILALPGNPVSVLVTARRMATAVLERLAGITKPTPPETARIADDGKRLDLWWHRLVRLTGPGEATLIDGRGSGDIPGAAGADGFVEIPPHEGGPGPWPFYSWAW